MISILVASLRQKDVESLRDHLKKVSKLPYELIVVSPFYVDDVVHVREDNIRGIYRAVKQGMKYVNGEYLLHMPDDLHPEEGWDIEMVNMIDNNKGDIVIGAFDYWSGQFHHDLHEYYGIKFSPTPFLRTSDLKKIGPLMDTAYFSFYGDPDLAMRVEQLGGKTIQCMSARMQIGSVNDDVKRKSMDKYEKIDAMTFHDRWRDGIKREPSYATAVL